MKQEEPPKSGPRLLRAAHIKGHRRRKLCSWPAYPHSCWQVHLSFFLWPKLNPDSAGFQCRQKPSRSLGILQDSSTKLGPQRHPPLWTKQLLDAQPFSCETAMVGLPGSQSVSYSNKSHVCVLNYMYMYTYMLYYVPLGILANTNVYS